MSKIDLFIIDDSELNNSETEKLASQNDRIGQISKFTDSLEALAKLVQAAEEGTKLPELILLDIEMPEMDGYEWLDEVYEMFDDPKFSVIFVSGTNYQKDSESFEKQGLVKALVPKPFTKEIFTKIIEDCFA